MKIVFRPEDVSLNRGDFLRPGHHKLATAQIEEINFVGAYERVRLVIPGPPPKSIIATRSKPEASATTIANRRNGRRRPDFLYSPTTQGHKNHMKFIYFLCSLLCLFVIPCAGQDTDNRQWTDVQIATPVTKLIDFNILGTLRLGRDISHPVDERIGAGFSFKLGKYLTFSPNYLHIGMQPVRGRRIWENRLSFPVVLRFGLGKFRLSDRNLIERRLRNSGAKSTRYRNRFQVDHSIGPDKLGFSLFAADEVFYDWSLDAWTRNRFSIGGSKVFNKHFTQDIYYLRQNDFFRRPRRSQRHRDNTAIQTLTGFCLPHTLSRPRAGENASAFTSVDVRER